MHALTEDTHNSSIRLRDEYITSMGFARIHIGQRIEQVNYGRTPEPSVVYFEVPKSRHCISVSLLAVDDRTTLTLGGQSSWTTPRFPLLFYPAVDATKDPAAEVS